MSAGRGGRGSATELERRYRRWLLAYPADYRRSWGDELVGTLLDLAEPGRTRPRPPEVLALLRSGLAQRLLHGGHRAQRRALAVLSFGLALLAAVPLLAGTAAGAAVCTAISTSDSDAGPCPGAQSWLESWGDLIILNRAGWAWLAVVLTLTLLPVIFGGRRIALLVAVLTTGLVLLGMPVPGNPFLPSVVVSWVSAVIAIRERTAHVGRGGDRVAG